MKETKKRKHKFLKILFLSLLILVSSLFISIVILLKTESGQHKTAQYIARFLSNKIETKVDIESAKFSFSSVTLNNIRIFDHRDTIMINSPELSIHYINFRQTPGQLRFKRMKMTDTYVNFVKHDQKEMFNFQYVIERIKEKSNNGKSTVILIDNIESVNSTMRYNQPSMNVVKGKMNHYDLYLMGVNIKMSDMKVNGPRVESNIDSASFIEKSGLVLNQIAGDLLIDSNELSFYNMSFFPGESEFYGDFGFRFAQFSDFKDFNNLITIKSDLHDSRLKISDLIYFADSLKTNEKEIFIDGEVEGELVDMRSKDIVLKFGKSSIYRGAIRMTGLPEIRETLLDFEMRKFDISFSDIHSLVPTIDFPEYFYESGILTFKGRYTGFINDFVAYGNLSTPYGEIESDLNFKIPAHSSMPNYSGNISLKDFNLGEFIGKKDLIGMVSMTGHVEGEGIRLDNVQTKVAAKAAYFEFNKYRYTNIAFDGLLANKLFEGGVEVNDANLDMDFNGTIDLSQKKPLYNFIADIRKSDLHELNFVTDKLAVNCIMEINVQASSLDDVEGRLVMLNAGLETTDDEYRINTLLLEADYNYGIKDIHLKSELAEADISGNFQYRTLPDLFLEVVSSYFDTSLFDKTTLLTGSEFISFDVKLHQTSFINKLIKSNIFFDDKSTIKGEISNLRNNIKLIASIPGLRVKDVYLSNVFVNASKEEESLIVYSSFGQVMSKDSVLAENLNVSAISNRDKIDFNLYFFNRRFSNHLTLNGDMMLRKNDFDLVLLNSYFLSQNNLKWDINSDTIKVNYDPLIQIPYIELSHADYKIKAYGAISKQGDQGFRVIVENTDFAFIQHYIPVNLSDFSGVLNGQLVIYDLLGSPHFDAAFLSNPFYFRGEKLGIFSVSSSHDMESSHTNIQSSLYSSEMEDILNVSGYIDFIDEKKIDLLAEIPQSEAFYFEPFLNNLVSDLTGEINAEIRFVGPLNDYKVKGKVNLHKTSFVVGYTQVRYTLNNDYIEVDEKGIYLDRIKFKDLSNNTGLVFGKVSHNYFRDFNLGIGILAQNLHGIHTSDKDNSIFYGDAYVTGRMDIIGPLKDIRMDMKLKSEKNTDFNLIAYDDNSFSNYNFIKFTNVNNQSRPVQVKGSTGITLNLDMEVTPDADIKIIFDPKTNDIISANGNGILKLQVDALGNTNMFGTFKIENGEYTFVALDLLKRKFNVKKGSTITFMGDPFEAEANIEAVYRIDASVYNLIRDNEGLTDVEKKAYQQVTYPVEAKLLLTESLYAPEVKLDFEILSTSSITGSQQSIILDQQVRSIKADEQELNKQVISLLILNGFLTPETGIVNASSFDNSLNANISSLASTQVSQWITGLSTSLGAKYSKYIDNFQFGVNWIAENNEYQRELDFIASGTLLNDRIELSGSYDVENVNADFQVNYQPVKDRKLRLKVFSRTDNNPVYQEDINRQGVGVYVKEEFDTWGELFRRRKKEK